jgi:hypothetical protein
MGAGSLDHETVQRLELQAPTADEVVVERRKATGREGLSETGDLRPGLSREVDSFGGAERDHLVDDLP